MFLNDLFTHRAMGWRPTPRRPFLRAAQVSSNRTAVFPQSKRSKGGSILKSRDITLLTKVHVVRAMVFLVVMYGCTSWTIKKAEHQRIHVFKLVLEKTLESPLGFKEIKPVNPKGNQP